MATPFSILAWRIPRSLASYSPRGREESDTAERLTLTKCQALGWALMIVRRIKPGSR